MFVGMFCSYSEGWVEMGAASEVDCGLIGGLI